VVGLGNIGSHAAMLVARLPQIARVILVDPDEVENKNLSSQSVRRSDIGRAKAVVMGRSLHEVRPDLEVSVHSCPLEDVPLADFRVDVILACLDSRAARMALNERAVALGVPLIDAGVAADGLLARVSVLSSEGPCLECAWSDDDYANLETVHACNGQRIAAASTSAPAFLGAAAAAFQAARCSELFHGALEGLARETVLDLTHGKLFVSSLKARSTCRMGPHRPWTIERVAIAPERCTLQAAFDLAPCVDSSDERSITCSRGPFGTRLRCVGCGTERELLRLVSSLTRDDRRCRTCGGEMAVSGMDQCERLDLSALGRAELARSLLSLGARVGDVITVCAQAASRHFEITAQP
jgi:molybdopterin/thiamine biosynthesis adenylyltransferase